MTNSSVSLDVAACDLEVLMVSHLTSLILSPTCLAMTRWRYSNDGLSDSPMAGLRLGCFRGYNQIQLTSNSFHSTSLKGKSV